VIGEGIGEYEIEEQTGTRKKLTKR